MLTKLTPGEYAELYICDKTVVLERDHVQYNRSSILRYFEIHQVRQSSKSLYMFTAVKYHRADSEYT